jgi:4-amino-4-deoxy-L-arabinose transferase-like glycosyltransferase
MLDNSQEHQRTFSTMSDSSLSDNDLSLTNTQVKSKEITDPVIKRKKIFTSFLKRRGTQQWLVKILPLLLLVIFLVIMLVTVFVQADQYGITIDEPGENTYGQLVWSWYATLGRDTSFLRFHTYSNIQDHGVIFNVIVAEAQHIFGGQWHTRAVVTGLAGVVGVLAIALCGFELAGWWGALLAALTLWLYPRYFGAIFNNSKDIPFAAAMALVLWSVLLLVQRWKTRRRYLLLSILVGFMLGLAIAVRVVAVIWYPILILLVAGWWLYSGRQAYQQKEMRTNIVKQVCAVAIITVVSLLTMIALWPYVAVDLLHNLYNAIKIMSQYPYNGSVPFDGHNYQAYNLPRSYVLTWLVIGSPPAVVFFAVIGGLVVCAILITQKRIDPKVIVICLALLVPVGTIIEQRTNLYDGLRQFLFVIPPMLLLAVYGFMKLFTYLARRRWTIAVVALVLLTLVAQVQVVRDMSNLHPYEYMYFSPLIGGVPGANGRYDMDYWGVCNKPSAEWLAQNYQKYTDSTSPTVVSPFDPELVLLYLPGAFKEVGSDPDFIISVAWEYSARQFPSYTIIHTEGVDGYVGCVVLAKSVFVRSRR